MSVIAPAHTPVPTPTRHRRPTRRLRLRWIAALVVVVLVAAVAAYAVVQYLHDDSRRKYLGADGWPTRGQAAYAVGNGDTVLGPNQVPAPIASVTKVMTAYLVLQSAPLTGTSSGFRMTVSAGDVADTAMRAGRDESVVKVAQGEVLTERDALAALLLPSANNVAIMLARHVSGSVGAFVTRMNTTATSLGMTHTTYTDPSGYSASTVSTAGDQVTLATVAMRNPVFAALVGTTSYTLPVAGAVHNTDSLLGQHGFVGIKTGSMDASGGCFMFRTVHIVDGHAATLTGVVLGQHGHNLIDAGLYAAVQFVDRITSSTPPV